MHYSARFETAVPVVDIDHGLTVVLKSGHAPRETILFKVALSHRKTTGSRGR